jgi:hypothetical protein
MIKNVTQLEATIVGKVHRFLCDSDSQVDHVIDALVQFLAYAKQIKDAAQKAQEEAQKQKEAETPASEQAQPEAA